MAKRLPRKNDAASIAARRDALGLDGAVTPADLEPYAGAAESVTGLAVIPVSVAELQISLGSYGLGDSGEVVETARADEEVFVPLAHTEGGLTASVQRGARAVAESGGFRTHVVADRITRASCFVCRDAADALTLARWIEEQVAGDAGVPPHVRHRRALALRGAPRGEDARRRADVPRALALDDGRRRRAEHDDA